MPDLWRGGKRLRLNTLTLTGKLMLVAHASIAGKGVLESFKLGRLHER